MTDTAVLLKTDQALGLYACVEDAKAEGLRAYLAEARIRFALDPELAAHLAEAGKRVFVFDRQHPHGIRDMIAGHGLPVEVAPNVVLPEKTYHRPLEQLLRLGDPSERSKAVNFKARGLDRQHIPELIRMATDEGLHTGPAGSTIYWGPVYAWWALGDLRAVEAIEPLLSLLRRVDDDDDDWAGEEIPQILAEFGTVALDPATAYLANPAHGDWARIGAAKVIELIAERFPDTCDDCIARLSAQLERYATQSATLNAFLILPLLDMGAEEAVPVMEKAFVSGRVDEEVVGDWEDVQIEFGMKTSREHPRKPNRFTVLGDKLRAIAKSKPNTQSAQIVPGEPEPLSPWAETSAEVGRNDPCPCGSGMKFKKCCGAHHATV
jgi:hypothetical protein